MLKDARAGRATKELDKIARNFFGKKAISWRQDDASDNDSDDDGDDVEMTAIILPNRRVIYPN